MAEKEAVCLVASYFRFEFGIGQNETKPADRGRYWTTILWAVFLLLDILSLGLKSKAVFNRNSLLLLLPTHTTASLISSFFNAEARFSADQPIRLDYLYDEPSLRCRSKRGSRILSTFNRFCPLRLSLSPFSRCIPTSRRPGPCLSVGVGRARVGAVPIFGQRVEATSLSETLLHHVVVITAEPLMLIAREASTFWKFHDFQYYVSMEAKD